MNHLRLSYFLAGILAIAGCGTERIEGLDLEPHAEPTSVEASKGTSTDALVVQTDLAAPGWARANIRVCFRTSSITAGERRVVADAADEWSRGTGLTFSGFSNCTVPVSNAEIGIIQDESDFFTGRAFGRLPYGAVDLGITYSAPPQVGCSTPASTRERCLHRTATHEVGHVLGFGHEQQILGDGVHDPMLGLSSCSTQAVDFPAGPAYRHGDWDLFSTMNYCNPNSRKPLSTSDKVGAQFYYRLPDAFADMDGDGFADAIDPNGRIAVRFSNGASFGPEVIVSATPMQGSVGTHFADVDGDGDADVVAMATDAITVRRSSGRGPLLPVEIWSGATTARNGRYLADVSGDGAADVILVSEDAVFVRRANPVTLTFGPDELWLTRDSFPLDSAVTLNGNPWRHIPFSASIQFGDVGGSPASDLVMFGDGTTLVFLSTGLGFSIPAMTGPSSLVGTRGTYLADVNGDTRKDAVIVNSLGIEGSPFNGFGSGVSARLAIVPDGGFIGTAFSSSSHSLSTDEFFGNRGTYFANVDGLVGDEAIIVASNRILVRRRIVPAPPTAPFFGPEEVWSSNFHARQIGLTLTQATAAVWRPAKGLWMIPSNGDEQWGQAGDIPVPADWDRDGLVDLAVWRPGDGRWYIIRSSDGQTMEQQWGTRNDIPVPADYDGDGWTDFAIYRPSEGMWYARKSSDGTNLPRQWGGPGDIPVPGLYDSDNKTDFAIYRPGVGGAAGEYLYVRSTTGVAVSRFWGTTGDVPVPGDYTGDGKTDLALWRPTDGVWYIKNAESAVPFLPHQQWGTSGDVPIPGHYHEGGDKRMDYAVWRPDGSWHIKNSETGAISPPLFWGKPGDVLIGRK